MLLPIDMDFVYGRLNKLPNRDQLKIFIKDKSFIFEILVYIFKPKLCNTIRENLNKISTFIL